MSHSKSNHQRRSRNSFPFNDDFLLFFLPILDDEEQMRLAALEEDDEPFDAFGFEGWLEDDREED